MGVGVMGFHDNTDHPKLKPLVVLTGSAKNCNASAPTIGLVDIGVSERSFLFRVLLPGIRNDRSKLKCEIQCNGKVQIQGIMTEGTRPPQVSSSTCQMIVKQVQSPGPFTISFNLPGSVDPRLVLPRFDRDGILEVVVMRYTSPSDPAKAWVPPS
ncbi:hypothetical protein PTKIN_Ptkin13bG0031500 [Pterospermum kingtungense]